MKNEMRLIFFHTAKSARSPLSFLMFPQKIRILTFINIRIGNGCGKNFSGFWEFSYGHQPCFSVYAARNVINSHPYQYG